MERKRFQHDCDDCKFLGHYLGHDIYHCPQGMMPTVLARSGDEGEQYTSVSFHAFQHIVGNPVFKDHDPFRAMLLALADVALKQLAQPESEVPR